MTDEIYSISEELGNYSVSNYGNVINKKTGVIKSQTIDKSDGTVKTTLFKNGKKRSIMVHRLVAFAFLNNPNHHPFVKHIDGNKQNNYYKNLEWHTHGAPVEGYNIKYKTIFY
jgi:hypothetical protein